MFWFYTKYKLHFSFLEGRIIIVMSRRSDLELTDSELMYQKRSATGSEEFAVQFRSTSSANVYLVFWPVM